MQTLLEICDLVKMRKIIISLSVVAAVAAAVVVGTTAFFSDTETSAGNTFTAGAIDLKVDSTQHFNNAVCVSGQWQLEPSASPLPGQYPVIGSACGGTWGQSDGLDIVNEKFFNFGDVKPGDSGENTVSLHPVNNDANICAYVTNLTNNDNGLTEPESKVDSTDGVGMGELQNNIYFSVWRDKGTQAYPQGACDNVYQPGEHVYVQNAVLDDNTGPWDLGWITGDRNVCLGVAWNIPTDVGNEIQTDRVTGDISFYAEQTRNNPNFQCPPSLSVEPKRLVLENETPQTGAPWTIIQDDIQGVLTWEGDGPTFVYSLTAQNLTPTTAYSLIYYADPWSGNNPGAFIGNGTTDSSGNLSFSGSPNLGIDLPMPADGNYAVGAKIWLVRSSDYNGGNLSTGPMTAWNPGQYLFEGNVYIHYNDTDN